MKNYILTGLVVIILVILANIAKAYDINAYQATEKGKTVLEIVDDCGKSYRLLVKNEELGTKKTLKWAEMIVNRRDFCLDK